MHELSLVEQLLQQCRHHAQGRDIQRVCVQVGALTCVDPDALRFCFEACRDAAGMAGAELLLTESSAEATCLVCGARFLAQSLPVICACGSSRCDVTGGQDLVLQALEFVPECAGLGDQLIR